jgi:hypothetical protein
LTSTWNGKAYLRVEATNGLNTSVPLEAVERRLQAVPYLRDALDLHRQGWLLPKEIAPAAEALGHLYHALPRQSLYVERVNQVREALDGNAARYAAHHDQGFQTLLRFIDALTQRPKGGQP